MDEIVTWMDSVKLFGTFVLLGATFSTILAVGITASFLRRSPSESIQPHGNMVTQKVVNQCQSEKTVTSELAKDPKQSAFSIFKDLYDNHHHLLHGEKNGSPKSMPRDEANVEKMDELGKARACGKWGSAEPSDLFLRVIVPLIKATRLSSGVRRMLTSLFELGISWCTECRGKEP